mmetsp:Transcript_6180/g.19787  ORF Transcript_6180/g.19787 Transcript_6180/m.19787 type:complete len:231 (+) Transcript_6180:376-1068(+)
MARRGRRRGLLGSGRLGRLWHVERRAQPRRPAIGQILTHKVARRREGRVVRSGEVRPRLVVIAIKLRHRATRRASGRARRLLLRRVRTQVRRNRLRLAPQPTEHERVAQPYHRLAILVVDVADGAKPLAEPAQAREMLLEPRLLAAKRLGERLVQAGAGLALEAAGAAARSLEQREEEEEGVDRRGKVQRAVLHDLLQPRHHPRHLCRLWRHVPVDFEDRVGAPAEHHRV